MMLTRQVADIVNVLQQFIPAVIQRISEIEGGVGMPEESAPEQGAGPGMPPQPPMV